MQHKALAWVSRWEFTDELLLSGSNAQSVLGGVALSVRYAASMNDKLNYEMQALPSSLPH